LSNRSALWKIWHSFCLLMVLAASLTLPLLAQDQQEPATTGTVQGTVRDANGNPVNNARVLFRSKANQSTTVSRTGKDGAYASEPLPPGDYTVKVEGRNLHIGRAAVKVQVGAAATADFKLDPINPEPIRTESATDGEAVDKLPINGRNYLDVARTDPGVQVIDGAILDPGKSGERTLSINSSLGRNTHYDLDEVEVMDETRGGVTQNVPADAVREVVVTRSMPEVFQALNGTGAVRVTTRSGEDEWHGHLFGNYRDRRAGLAGFPSGDPNYSRQHYGFGAGGAIIKDKAFLFVAGERAKQDGRTPVYQGFPFNFLSTRDATYRENMLSARLDYQWSESAKSFVRVGYDNANQIGPTDSLAAFRDQINVPSAVFGLDWNHGRFAHSGRFGYQKLVNAINPALGSDLFILGNPFHQQLGSFESGPSIAGPRQTIQRDFFGRYDGSTPYRDYHTLRFGGVIHHIEQGDFYTPGIGNFGPSVTSSNGVDVINAINLNPTFPTLIPGDPRGPADNPMNYPVGTLTIFNGLGSFSEHSAFNRSTGGHTDDRIELYAADTLKLYPNLNITVGVNYVRDTGRVNSDIGSLPCSAVNTSVVTNPLCTSDELILDQFGDIHGLGKRVSQPNWNFAPQAGLAWDPGRHGTTVVHAGGGLFFDNFLLQNAYQDRISRLSQGQYFRSLNLCPTGTVLFPDGTRVSSVDELDIATQICGQPIGNVAGAIQHLQSQFLAAQSALTGGPNIYSLTNSLANFGGTLAPNYRTPRVLHMSAGVQHQFGEHNVLTIDYVRQIGTQFPLGIDTNHVGDARYLADGSSSDISLNTYQTELNAINATLAANPAAAGCAQATSAGASSQSAVNCYLANVPTASITDFAVHGLDSANALCGPFPCSVLGLPEAAFSGIHAVQNPADSKQDLHLGSNVMYFPTGRSKYQAVHVGFKTSRDLSVRGVRRVDLAFSYTFSKYESNVAAADGSGGDFSLLTVAEDYNSPHVGHFGSSGLDRRNQFTIAPSFDLLHGLKLSVLAYFASPLSISARLPQLDGGGAPGEIFRTDATGDGTVGDLLPGTQIGGLGGYSGSSLNSAVSFYNSNYAGRETAAGQKLVSAQLFTSNQLSKLGAVYPFLQPVPTDAAQLKWLRTVDLRLSWPLRVGEHVRIEPTVAAFNVLNLANFSGPGRLLSGVLDGSPGSSLNNSTSSSNCGTVFGQCTARLDRIVNGSGTYALGAPRQIEYGFRITF
jgi:carboxypeptidase family protein